MSDTVASKRTRYAITNDGLFLHGSRFVRCGSTSNLYILDKSASRGISYLGIERIGGYWYVNEFLFNDDNQHQAYVYRGVTYRMDCDKYISISQAAKQLIKLYNEEEAWYDQLAGKN